MLYINLMFAVFCLSFPMFMFFPRNFGFMYYNCLVKQYSLCSSIMNTFIRQSNSNVITANTYTAYLLKCHYIKRRNSIVKGNLRSYLLS